MRRAVLGAVLVVAASLPAPSAANPLILAHRGGPIERGKPAYGEATLPAFREAARRGYVLEFDVHVTSDGVPVVVHDDTLDRVVAEDCPHRGKAIRELSLEQVRSCPVVFRGRPGEGLPQAPLAPPQPIPTLDEVVDVAGRHAVTISPEIKNNPPVEGMPSDFDPTPGFATAVATALRDSGFPQQRMIVQSFYPPNLDGARSLLPDAQLLFLTLGPLNEGSPTFAKAKGYHWIGPQLTADGLPAGLVDQAHDLGLKVAPYTPNTPAEFELALGEKVDGIFTDDPRLLDDLLHLAPLRVAGRPRSSGDCRVTVGAHRTDTALVVGGRWCGRGRVRVSLARRAGGRCEFLKRDGELGAARSCRRPVLLRTRGQRRWRRALPARLPRGRYVLLALSERNDTILGRVRLPLRA